MDFAINGSLPELVEAFSKTFPQIAIDLVQIPSTLQQDDIQDAIQDSSVDVGFMIVSNGMDVPTPITASMCQSGGVIDHSPRRGVYHADHDNRA